MQYSDTFHTVKVDSYSVNGLVLMHIYVKNRNQKVGNEFNKRGVVIAGLPHNLFVNQYVSFA